MESNSSLERETNPAEDLKEKVGKIMKCWKSRPEIYKRYCDSIRALEEKCGEEIFDYEAFHLAKGSSIIPERGVKAFDLAGDDSIVKLINDLVVALEQ